MAHFYASIKGNRGETTRMGSKDSGISGHIRGWDTGVRVDIRHSAKDGKDHVLVYRTAGSNGHAEVLIAEWVGGKATTLHDVRYADLPS